MNEHKTPHLSKKTKTVPTRSGAVPHAGSTRYTQYSYVDSLAGTAQPHRYTSKYVCYYLSRAMKKKNTTTQTTHPPPAPRNERRSKEKEQKQCAQSDKRVLPQHTASADGPGPPLRQPLHFVVMSDQAAPNGSKNSSPQPASASQPPPTPPPTPRPPGNSQPESCTSSPIENTFINIYAGVYISVPGITQRIQAYQNVTTQSTFGRETKIPAEPKKRSLQSTFSKNRQSLNVWIIKREHAAVRDKPPRWHPTQKIPPPPNGKAPPLPPRSPP